jgi:hypothetical protein
MPEDEIIISQPKRDCNLQEFPDFRKEVDSLGPSGNPNTQNRTIQLLNHLDMAEILIFQSIIPLKETEIGELGNKDPWIYLVPIRSKHPYRPLTLAVNSIVIIYKDV